MPIYRTPKRGIAYSEALAAAYASAPEDEVIIDTLEFRHASFVDSGSPFAIRIVNDHEKFVATLEAGAPMNGGESVTFLPVAFELTRPSESDSGATPEIEITIDNAARYLMPYLDRVKESRDLIEVTWRPYLASDVTGPHMNPPLTLTLRSISADMHRVTARAGFGDLVNRRFPALEYTPKNYPGRVAR